MDDVVEDDVALVAKKERHVKVDARRVIVAGGWINAVFAEVYPKLPGKAHYRVKMKVKHQGRWVICKPYGRYRVNNTVARTFQYPDEKYEYVVFGACKNKGARKCKIIVPAQHGFARTTARAHW